VIVVDAVHAERAGGIYAAPCMLRGTDPEGVAGEGNQSRP